jgi:cation:H+ antiporter
MTLSAVLLIGLGVALLVFGAEFLVKGASRLAGMAGISPLIIGLTVVAFGTSMPELAVSVQAAITEQADIALGNVVGSNICNVLLILGAAAMVSPLVVAQQLIRWDVPIMIGVSGLVLLFCLDSTLTRSDGIILFIGGLLYTLFLLYQSQREKNQAVQAEYAQEYGQQPFHWQQVSLNGLFVAVGLVALVAGSKFLVKGAVAIATALGASPLIIGLTIVALGTSLPELATSMVASFRGERDIAVGNVVGSNIFNLLVVLGLTSILAPNGIHVAASALAFDIPVMVAVAVMCFPIFFVDNLITRWEGGILLSYYLAYTLYLFLKTTDHESMVMYGGVLKFVVVPLTILGLSLMAWQAQQAKQKR